MKRTKSKFIIMIIISIIIIYIVYNFSIGNTKKENNELSVSTKDKIIVANIRIGIINFDNINPILSNNSNVQNISKLIFEPLFNLTNDYKIEPCLASEWSKLNKTTYLIKIRENVNWQDGYNLSSDDVIYTVNMLKEYKNKSIYFNNIENIKEIKKIDEYTIQIITTEEIPYFEYNLIFPIMSKKYFNKENLNSKDKNINIIGTGMYYISDYNNDNIILKKNTNWWNSKELKLDTIQINLYKNFYNAINDFQTSNVDFIMSSAINIDEYIDGIQCNKVKYIGRNYDYIAMNCNNKILKNKDIRRAIKYAINKDEIIQNVYNNQYTKSTFPLDFGSFIYNKGSEAIEYNIEESKKILKNSNINYNVLLNLLVNKNNDERLKVAKLIKEQLDKIGVIINIVEKDKKEYKKLIKEGQYDIVLTGNTYSYSPSLNSYYGNKNIANYSNEEIIKKINEIEKNNEEQESKTLLLDVIKDYNENSPYISLYYNTSTILYSSNIKGEISPNSYNVFYNIESWYREFDR